MRNMVQWEGVSCDWEGIVSNCICMGWGTEREKAEKEGGF